ncbi:MAG: DUF951 domain-containing protein [Firmicutes bacterium]|nr:DUF951 domain-containing protein [Bacillota bacterium]
MAKYSLGQIVSLKKKHPCGENRWKIIRIGMDFRLKCEKCGRSVLLPRARFEQRVKEILEDNK